MWVLIACIWIIDFIWLLSIGIQVEQCSLIFSLAGAALLRVISGIYRKREPSLCICADSGAKIVLFSASAAILTYLVVTLGAPISDNTLIALDNYLGFDWLTWFAWVDSHPLLRSVMSFAYATTGPQIIFWWILLSLTGKVCALQEFLWAAMISILLIIPIWAILPAKGPWVFYDIGLHANWIQDFLSLRDHSFAVMDLKRMVGIIVCPSFHTALGLIFIYISRYNRILFAGSIIINGCMILSVPTEGSHYLFDVIAGGVVTLLAIRLSAYAAHRTPYTLWTPFSGHVYVRTLGHPVKYSDSDPFRAPISIQSGNPEIHSREADCT